MRTVEELYLSEVLGLDEQLKWLKGLPPDWVNRAGGSDAQPNSLPCYEVGVYLGPNFKRSETSSEELVILEKMALAMGLEGFDLISTKEELSERVKRANLKLVLFFISQEKELEAIGLRAGSVPGLGEWGELLGLPCLRTYALADLVVSQPDEASLVRDRKVETWKHLKEVMERLKAMTESVS